MGRAMMAYSPYVYVYVALFEGSKVLVNAEQRQLLIAVCCHANAQVASEALCLLARLVGGHRVNMHDRRSL